MCCPGRRSHPVSEDDAVGAFAAGGGAPVVLKADVPELVHKTEAGGVELDLRTEADVRAACQRLTERFGGKLHAILVQPMIGDGTEVIVSVADDHLFGPLVVFGLGGVATEVLADHAARLSAITWCAPQPENQTRPSCQRGDSPNTTPSIRTLGAPKVTLRENFAAAARGMCWAAKTTSRSGATAEVRGLIRVRTVSQPGRPWRGNRAPDRNSIGNSSS